MDGLYGYGLLEFVFHRMNVLFKIDNWSTSSKNVKWYAMAIRICASEASKPVSVCFEYQLEIDIQSNRAMKCILFSR